MAYVITNGVLVTPHTVLYGQAVRVEDGRITAVGADVGSGEVIDAAGMYVIPGMIDVHVHGSDGHDTMDATPEALHGMARFFARHGVTGYLATTMSAPAVDIRVAIANATATPLPADGAAHLGVHIEGPYLSAKHPGAQSPEVLRDADPAEYGYWLESDIVRLITAAPERPGVAELIRVGVARGIEFALGHTDMDYEQTVAAAGMGVRQATHTFNAMVGIHHRNPGTAGAVLTDDRIYAQLIGDGIHVHPAVVKLLARAKGAQRVILITDAMRAAGLPDGEYGLGDQMVRVQGGIARTAGGALAGSTATLDGVLRNMMRFTGLSLSQVLPMATSTPAEALGLTGRKGVLAVGADADIVLLDSAYQVQLTMVGGDVAFQQ